MPWCPCPFKNKANRLVNASLKDLHLILGHVHKKVPLTYYNVYVLNMYMKYAMFFILYSEYTDALFISSAIHSAGTILRI